MSGYAKFSLSFTIEWIEIISLALIDNFLCLLYKKCILNLIYKVFKSRHVFI